MFLGKVLCLLGFHQWDWHPKIEKFGHLDFIDFGERCSRCRKERG